MDPLTPQESYEASEILAYEGDPAEVARQRALNLRVIRLETMTLANESEAHGFLTDAMFLCEPSVPEPIRVQYTNGNAVYWYVRQVTFPNGKVYRWGWMEALDDVGTVEEFLALARVRADKGIRRAYVRAGCDRL